MIKNWAGWLAVALALTGCRGPDAELAGHPFQGVIEYEERDLAFEISGRLAEVLVDEGQVVTAGTVIARLDPSLARTALEARQGEARAAADQLALLRAGARREDIGAMRARLGSARASEALLQRTNARMRQLSEAGAATPAAFDETQANLRRAQGERRALEENLAALTSGARSQEVEAAQHRLEAAQAAAQLEEERLARHELRARTDGEVLEVHLETSEMAPAGVPVVTVAEVARPYADVFVPQAQITEVRQGAAAFARVDGLADEVPGRVEVVGRRTEFTPRYLFSRAERSTLVLRVRVRLQDPQHRLRAGIPTFVRIDSARADEASRK
jgi:HlyD family secretion protein